MMYDVPLGGVAQRKVLKAGLRALQISAWRADWVPKEPVSLRLDQSTSRAALGGKFCSSTSILPWFVETTHDLTIANDGLGM